MATTKSKNFNFEQALQELGRIVDHMEQSEINLEASLQNFERGIQLTRECQKALNQAEQKVKILMEKNKSESLLEFDTSTLDED